MQLHQRQHRIVSNFSSFYYFTYLSVLISLKVSDGDHEKISKKDLLIGRRKDKKDKKDRGYAALEGDSSQDEELLETK